MKGMNNLKPKLGVLFSQITDSEISELQVEKISVSKNRRKIKILLGSKTSSYLASKVESELKKTCNLSEVIVVIKEPDKEIDRNVVKAKIEDIGYEVKE